MASAKYTPEEALHELCVYPHVRAVRACTPMGELCVYPRVPAVRVPTWVSCACIHVYQLCVYPRVPAVGVPPCTSCVFTPLYELCVYPRVPAEHLPTCTSCGCIPVYQLCVYPYTSCLCTHMYQLCVPPCTSCACTHMYELRVYARVPAVCVPTWISWVRTPVHAHISQEQTAGRPLPPSHHIIGNFLNFPSHFSTAKSSFNSFKEVQNSITRNQWTIQESNAQQENTFRSCS